MSKSRNNRCIVTFYHDIEQDLDSDADPKVCREMVDRFIEIENRHGARATYDVVGKLFNEQPEMIDAIRAAGHEVAFHSHGHHRDWNPAHYADEVALCRATSTIPKGYRSPRSQWGPETLDALHANGFLWSAENEPHRREPYFIHRGIVRLPIMTDDWPVFTGRQTHEAWLRQFEKALDARPYVAIGIHDCVAATDPATWLESWDRLVRTAAESNALMLTFSEAADLYRRGAVARHYDATATEWNDHSRTLYRSKRFQEILRQEAAKLDAPVVADLASAGGMQSEGVSDIAGRIYCVDNSPGMVASIPSTGVMEGRLGELTATGLPDRSIDVVFCVNAVEYVFDTRDFAAELKRMARPDAACIVAFPALGGCPPRPPTSPPDRIQHYFTRDEVVAFGEAIGPGRVFGIQYDPTEPETLAIEDAYREAETTAAPDAIPMFWVYVGTVDGRPLPASPHRVIALDRCPFAFRNQRFERYKSAYRSAKKRVPKPVKAFAKALLGRQPRH